MLVVADLEEVFVPLKRGILRRPTGKKVKFCQISDVIRMEPLTAAFSDLQ
jgi:hypothetical protein